MIWHEKWREEFLVDKLTYLYKGSVLMHFRLLFHVPDIINIHPFCFGVNLWAWINEKCLATKHHQTLFGEQTLYPLDWLVWCCLIVFDRTESRLVVFDKFERHQIFDQKLKLFHLLSCLMGNVCSFGKPRIKHVWCGHAYHVCSAACINCLISAWSNMS